MNFYKLMMVGAGGFLGSIVRYFTTRSLDDKINSVFPYGTLMVNVVGSLIIGVLYGCLIRKAGEGENLRLLIGTGFCGGFTTYSAFALENVNLIQNKLLPSSLLYIAITILAGFLAVVAGMWLGKSIS